MSSFPALRVLPSMLLFCGILSSIGLTHATNSSGNFVKPDVLLAQNYQSTMNPALYLVSEKLDGVRALWDGKTLRFRSGNLIHAPAWFTAGFPDHPLDGELWMGRRRFDQVSAATRRQEPNDAEWRQISYQLVELPEGQGSFSERLSLLKSSVAKSDVAWLQVVDQFPGLDDATLQATLENIARDGGEGLMLHRADALWQTGRSNVLLKLKIQSDAEATVIAYVPGKGKYVWQTGALLVEMPNGTRFKLGSGLSDELRRNPPAIGSIVTYRYRDITPKGIPRFASYWRERITE